MFWLAAGLAGCEGEVRRGGSDYHYYPLSMDERIMVEGCDGYTLGTVRVNKLTGDGGTCLPLRAGCNDTRSPGCGQGRFAKFFNQGDSTTEPGHPNEGVDDRAAQQEK